MSGVTKDIRRRAFIYPEKKEAWKWAEDAVERIPYSPMGGKFSSDHHPAIRDVLSAMVDPENPLVMLLIGVQAFKTLSLELAAAHGIANDPMPTGFYLDQDPNAKDQMKTRLKPLFENTKGVRELIPTGADKDNNTTTTIIFRNGMPFWCLGANNVRNRQRRSLARVYLDECWLYPKEQNAIGELIKRTSAFPFPKVVLASQGSDEGDEFDQYWQTTDQRDWLVPCLECGHLQALKWERVKFESIKLDDGSYDYAAIEKAATYECEKCEHAHADLPEVRRDMNGGGRFEATNEGAQKGRVGFRVNAISFKPWGELVCEYLRAKQQIWSSSDYGPMKLFMQQRLAVCFGDGEIGDDFEVKIGGSGYVLADEWEDEARWKAIRRKGKATGKVYNKILIIPGTDERVEKEIGWHRCRTLCVDIQRDHFFATLRVWSADGGSRLLWAGRMNSWEEIEKLAEKFGVHPLFVWLDSGDSPYAESGVYAWASEKGWRCLRGDQGKTWRHIDEETGNRIERYYSPPRSVTLGRGKRAINFYWSNLNVKDILARLMQRPDRFGVPEDIHDLFPEYSAQMNSERRMKNPKTKRYVWKQIGKRPNHIWDCEAMQVVVALYLKLLGADVETAAEGDETEN